MIVVKFYAVKEIYKLVKTFFGMHISMMSYVRITILMCTDFF